MKTWIVTEVQGFPAFEDTVKHSNSFPYFICLMMHGLIKNQQLFFKVAHPVASVITVSLN